MAEDSKEIAQKVITWVNHICKQRHWTPTDLARKSSLAPSTLLRILNDPNHQFAPSFKTIRKISEGSGYPVPDEIINSYQIVTEDEDDGVVSRYRGPRNLAHSDLRPTAQADNMQSAPRFVPVRRISSLPGALQPQQRNADQERVPCPPQFENDRTVFAFHMPDDALAPVLPAASLCYARNFRDPKVDDIIVVTLTSGRSLVRMLLKVDEHGFTLGGEESPVKFDEIESVSIVQMFMRQ